MAIIRAKHIIKPHFADSSGYRNITFPYTFSKTCSKDNTTRKIVVDIVRDSSRDKVVAGLNRWEAHFDRDFPYYEYAIYNEQVNRQEIDMYKRSDDEVFFSSAKGSGFYLLAAMSGAEMEAVSLIQVLMDGSHISNTFLGLAPWNLAGKNPPRFSGLSHDMFSITLATALRFASMANEQDEVFFANFISERGMSFAKRLFKRKAAKCFSIHMSLKKQGIEAFLQNDRALFLKNASLTVKP